MSEEKIFFEEEYFLKKLKEHMSGTYGDKYAHGIEPILFYEAHGMWDFHRANIIKYVIRSKYRPRDEDLLKAGHYLARLYLGTRDGDGREEKEEEKDCDGDCASCGRIPARPINWDPVR